MTMPDFLVWFTELCSDQRWYENSIMSNRGKNFKQAAQDVYAVLLADHSLQDRPMSENRTHVYNRLRKLDFERVFPVLQQEEKKVENKEWVPLTGEARMSKLKEWEAEIKKVEMQSAVPVITHKQAIEEGGWLPPKGPVHPITKPMEAYVKDRHIAYIEYAYEPRTAEKKPGVMSEEQFNYEYDEIMLNNEGR